MEKKFKKRWILCVLIVYLIYFVIGASVPFFNYKKMDIVTIENLTHDEIFTSDTSIDRAMLLETNLSAWEERIRLLNLAKNTIILSTFDMRDGESTKDLASILLHKAEEGVKIYILVDGYNGTFMNGKSIFYALSSHKNIEIKLYSPLNLLTPWTSQGRMHDKYIIIDDLAYILGGRNTFDYFIGNYESKSKSHDREVLIYNTASGTIDSNRSSVTELYNYFNAIWQDKVCVLFHDNEDLRNKKNVKQKIEELKERYEGLISLYPELFVVYDYVENTYETNGVKLLSNPTTIYGKEPVVFYQLTELMKVAKDRVMIHTPYAVCNSYMYERLKEVVDLVPNSHIMLNSIENGDNFFASSDYMRNKGDLIETGLPIYEYDGGTSYHGKSIVIDDTISIIGSFNFDLRSVYVDTELMLVVNSEGLTKELANYMEQFEKDCRQVVSLKEYITPDHIVVKSVPVSRRIAMDVVGFIMQAFRFLL